jgi:NAD(P)H-hydrate epimerase
MNEFPTKLYTPEAVATFDRRAIESGIPGYTLMRRAGQAVFDVISTDYPEALHLLVLCGAGNNAGDGYVVARLAHHQGLNVNVVSLIDPEILKGDARQAYLQWKEVGDITTADYELIETVDAVIDAMLGTGIDRDVEGEWKDWIDAVNTSEKPVIAIDVPSGLDAFTGEIKGSAVYAETTVTFIGLKSGLFTSSGKACCGDIVFDSLDVPEEIYNGVDAVAELLGCPDLPVRSHDSHKGHHGHVLVIGGNAGMPGAVILAAKAALRSGAGLVSVVTRLAHIPAVAAACPEATVHGSINGELPLTLNMKISCIAIGPGLGQDAWGHRLLSETVKLEKPLVLDADALNLLTSRKIELHSPHVITPHPGEAARLLSVSVADIQSNRFISAQKLHELMQGVIVLKGSGTLVYDGQQVKVCPFGNPAMAVAGMGDVLTGVIASLAAQGLEMDQAAAAGVWLHAMAGDLAADGGDRGVLASDVIDQLRLVTCS